jgi:hypothetical protein
VVLDPQAEDEVFAKTWDLKGVSAEGYPAMGSFSVMVPPPKPGPDAGTTIFDPLMKQKIMLAREMLGKDVVDDEDLWRLDREGAFANLKVSPADVAAANSAAIAAAVQAGPPSQPQGPPTRGPAVPKSINEQQAPAAATGTASTSGK